MNVREQARTFDLFGIGALFTCFRSRSHGVFEGAKIFSDWTGMAHEKHRHILNMGLVRRIEMETTVRM